MPNPLNPLAKPEPQKPCLALRPREAAKALGIGERLLWEMTSRGEVPCTRIGRCVIYPTDQLREWLAGRTEGGQA